MALRSEYGSEKKMAEGGNEAEQLKEKANNYFKGRVFQNCQVRTFRQVLPTEVINSTKFCIVTVVSRVGSRYGF